MSLLGFHHLAKANGDGLHPALRNVLEQRAAMAADPQIIEMDAARSCVLQQSGPNPACRPAGLRLGNVIEFQPRSTAMSVCTPIPENAKGIA